VRHFTHRPDDEVEGSVGSLSRFPELFCRTCAAPGAGHRGADFWHGITPSFGLVYGTPSPGDKRPVYERFLWQTIRATTYAKGNGCVSTGNSADLGRTQLASTRVVELGAQCRPAAPGTRRWCAGRSSLRRYSASTLPKCLTDGWHQRRRPRGVARRGVV